MVFGILVILIGVVAGINVLFPELNIDFGLIVAGVIFISSLTSMIKNKKFDFLSGLFVLCSIWYILISFNVLNDVMRSLLWPFIIIITGISLVLESKDFKNRKKNIKVEKEGQLTYHAIFAGIEEKVKGNNFKGCKIYSICGGCDLDLREIKLDQNVSIEVYSIFGGTELLLPKDYKVVLESKAILGGNENKAMSNENGKYTIFIKAISVFGGCDLK